MKLVRLTERVWYYPFEQERDRPNLGYIRGEHFSIAVDAGHSAAHTAEFYRAVEAEGLPLPRLTVITHWHWDHTCGMHAVNGLTAANERTNLYLTDLRKKIAENGPEGFFAMHESIRREYEKDRTVTVVPADIVFPAELMIDAGDCPVRVFRTESPHTDDGTLIYACDEKVLFIGDANSGPFPTWKKELLPARKLAGTISAVDADICLEGHWTPDSKQGLIDDILDGCE